MNDKDKIYADPTQAAILRYADKVVDCPTLQEAVLEWMRLSGDDKKSASIAVRDGPTYGAAELDRLHIKYPSENKSVISEHETEELIKGMGRVATVVVHDNGLVRATAISANPSDTRIQNEVDSLLSDIMRKYRIVKKRRP